MMTEELDNSFYGRLLDRGKNNLEFLKTDESKWTEQEPDDDDHDDSRGFGGVERMGFHWLFETFILVRIPKDTFLLFLGLVFRV